LSVSYQKFMMLFVIVLGGLSVWAILPTEADRTHGRPTSLRMGLDIQGGLHMNLEVDQEKYKGKTPQEVSEAADRALEILRNRVDKLGVTEPLLQREGVAGIVVQFPGLEDYRQAQEIILSTAQLEFRLVSRLPLSEFLDKDGKVAVPKLPKDITYLPGKDEPHYLCEKVLLTGEALVDAKVETDNLGRPIVGFKLNAEGGKRFGVITGENVHRQLAIILDGKVYSAPEIQSRIPGGSGIIQGSFTDEEAGRLAIVLKSGALPAPMKITSQFLVGPTLGKDSVEKGTKAAFFGLLLVLLYMVLFYRLSGLIANFGMLMNVILLMGFMAGLKATLTLPGIAGIVLTVGMSVDSNVLIFERIREELKVGKTVRAAIEAGYQRALTAIIDSHVTTLITSVVLFQFGTGPVKGFAVTLSVGVALSLFTAVVITKMIFDARKEYQTLSI